jgi:GT2 family glycosyltransferase
MASSPFDFTTLRGQRVLDVSEVRLPVTVVIPTIGRSAVLRACLGTVAACRPGAAEILVVDQSHDPAIAALVDDFTAAGARLVPSYGRGVARGRNDGLRVAAHDVVLGIDDDCTVSPDWIATGRRLAALREGAIVTGRVLAVGDPRAVPSTIDEPTPRDLTGERWGAFLFSNNMVLPRDAVLELGGFDERFGPEEVAEDNELCYRWLQAGKQLFYEPDLVVEHHDWRTPEELERLYVRYARGEGYFYSKHLRRGDLRMLLYLARTLAAGARGLLSATFKRREAWTDSRRGILRGLPGGFVDGWRVFRKDV